MSAATRRTLVGVWLVVAAWDAVLAVVGDDGRVLSAVLAVGALAMAVVAARIFRDGRRRDR